MKDLKNKKKTVDTKFFETKPQRGVTTVDVYLEGDIDKLRQEIIEELNNMINKVNKKFGYV
jgi:hypothetical protein